VRLAQGQIRSVVADHSNNLDRHVARQGFRKIRESNESDASNAEDRHREVKGCLRWKLILSNPYGLGETKTQDD